MMRFAEEEEKPFFQVLYQYNTHILLTMWSPTNLGETIYGDPLLLLCLFRLLNKPESSGQHLIMVGSAEMKQSCCMIFHALVVLPDQEGCVGVMPLHSFQRVQLFHIAQPIPVLSRLSQSLPSLTYPGSSPCLEELVVVVPGEVDSHESVKP